MDKAEKKEFYRELMSLAVPIGLQNLLIALVGASDALMLGRLSQNAVAAVSLANQIYFVMTLFSGSIIGGGSALIAQYWGKGDRNMGKNLFCFMSKCSFVISLVFFCLGMFFPRQLIRIYTPDPELIEIGSSYLRIVSVSYLFNGLSQCHYTMMKIEGKAGKSVMIASVALVADMVCDLFLIYGIAGFPALGSDGSALSTVVTDALAFLWCVAESRKKGSTSVDMKGIKWFSKDICRDMGKISMPMFASSMAWGIGMTLHSFMMGHLGADVTAAGSISSVMLELVSCVCKGVSSGAGVMTGKLLGQNMFEKAKRYGKKFCHVSFVVGGIHVGLIGVFSLVIIRFFLLTPLAAGYLKGMLIFMCLYAFAYSINTIVVCGVFPAGGDARYDAISVMFATWCFAIPLSLLGTFVFHWHPLVVYAIMNADEIVKLPWIYPRYRKYLWLSNLTREEKDGEDKIAVDKAI